MGIFDKMQRRRRRKKKTVSSQGQAASKGKIPPKKLRHAHESEQIPGHLRTLARDERLLPKPPPKYAWDKPSVLDADEARRLFSPGFRTRNRELRSLATDATRLAELGLPVWESELELAIGLDLSVQHLRWLAVHRFDDAVCHYVQFAVPKRNGGRRVIMAPKRRLKQVQRSLLPLLVDKLPVDDHAHGFRAGRSVRTNAEPHVGRKVVVKFDLENFFGTVTFARVRGFFLACGYSFPVATNLALLTTEAERQPVDVGGKLHYVPLGHRACPQGAPTSPGICNAIARKLDRRLAGFARSIGWSYTRYADDLTFSGNDDTKIGLLLRVVSEVVTAEGFRLQTAKTRVMRSGRAQQVTGVTVNEKLGLSRKERRKMRAAIHQLEHARAEGAPRPDDEDALRGKLAYLEMLNPAQAAALHAQWSPPEQ